MPLREAAALSPSMVAVGCPRWRRARPPGPQAQNTSHLATQTSPSYINTLSLGVRAPALLETLWSAGRAVTKPARTCFATTTSLLSWPPAARVILSGSQHKMSPGMLRKHRQPEPSHEGRSRTAVPAAVQHSAVDRGIGSYCTTATAMRPSEIAPTHHAPHRSNCTPDGRCAVPAYVFTRLRA